MRKASGMLGLGLVCVCTLVAPTAGQETVPVAADGVVQELGEIRRSLDELVVLFSRLSRNQDLELVLRRIEMRERRLAPLESRLSANQSEQFQLKTGIAEMESYVEEIERRLRERERDGNDAEVGASKEELEMLGTEIQRRATRLESLVRRGLELEDSLADGRDEIQLLDDLLEQMLE